MALDQIYTANYSDNSIFRRVWSDITAALLLVHQCRNQGVAHIFYQFFNQNSQETMTPHTSEKKF